MRILVLGASGGTGRQLIRELTGRNHVVGAGSRRPDRVVTPPGTTPYAIDPADREGLQTASAQFDAIVNCTGPGSDHASLSGIAEALRATIDETGIRVVHLSSAWSFTPLTGEVLAEDSPRAGGPVFLQHRRRSEDALAAAGAIVLHLPDFFGPGVGISPLQYALQCAVDRVAFRWIAARSVAREHLFVPDGMRAVADLLAVTTAAGQRLLVPGSGPLDMERLAEILVGAIGRTPDWREPSEPATSGVDATFMQGLGEMRAEYEKPVAYDGGKLMSLLPNHRPTPYEVAIPVTLESITGRVGV